MLIDKGKYVNTKDLARRSGIDDSLVARCIRMSMLAPKRLYKIIAGEAPKSLTMASFKHLFPEEWNKQIEYFMKEEYNKAPEDGDR